MIPKVFCAAIALVILTTLLCSQAWSVNMTVSPIRVFFEQGEKTNIIKVVNHSEGKLNFQAKLYKWEQATGGKDVYTETSELIVFPRIGSIAQRDGEQLIKVGIKTAATGTELTYRLYIEELPDMDEQRTAPGIRTLLRLGIPIFISPTEPLVAGNISDASIKRGKMSFNVNNTGNVFFRVLNVTLTGLNKAGKEVYKSDNTNARYVLSGVTSRLEFPIPSDKCSLISALRISVKSDKSAFSGDINVQPAMCK